MASKSSSRKSKERMSTASFFGVMLLSAVVVIGGSVLIGRSDAGWVDVSEAIKNSNQERREANDDASTIVNEVPERFRGMRNGGLVPRGSDSTPVVAEEPEPVVDATAIESENAATEDITEEVSTEDAGSEPSGEGS